MDIYTCSISGELITNLTNTADRDEFAPAWSPDGRSIAFDDGHDLYVMSGTGTDLRQLTSTTDVDEIGTTWSNDGARIACFGGSGTSPLRPAVLRDKLALGGPGLRQALPQTYFDIYMVDVATGEIWNFSNTAATSEAFPAFSPVSDELVYVDLTAKDIVLVNSDGTGSQQVTNTPDILEFAPTWSPTGAALVYCAYVPEPANVELYRSTPGGGIPDNLTATYRRSELHPSWSVTPGPS